MTNLLDKFKVQAPTQPISATPIPNQASQIPTTPIPSALDLAIAKLSAKSTGKTAAPSSASPIASPIAAATKPALPSLSNSPSAALLAAQQALKATAIKVEAKQLAAPMVVPEEIYTLDQRLVELPGFPANPFSEHLAATYKALHEDQPNLASMLEAINKNLRQYEELSYLLTEAQLNLYFTGLMKVAGSQIKTVAPKKTTANIQQQVAKEGGLDLSAL